MNFLLNLYDYIVKNLQKYQIYRTLVKHEIFKTKCLNQMKINK